MLSKKYRLSYLSLFYEDLDEKVTYIAEVLRNPKAANDLLDKVEAAIMERFPVTESFEPYHSVRERKYPYYRIYVDNYVVYYVVIDDTPDDLIMEVRRCLYSGHTQILLGWSHRLFQCLRIWREGIGNILCAFIAAVDFLDIEFFIMAMVLRCSCIFRVMIVFGAENQLSNSTYLAVIPAHCAEWISSTITSVAFRRDWRRLFPVRNRAS